MPQNRVRSYSEMSDSSVQWARPVLYFMLSDRQFPEWNRFTKRRFLQLDNVCLFSTRQCLLKVKYLVRVTTAKRRDFIISTEHTYNSVTQLLPVCYPCYNALYPYAYAAFIQRFADVTPLGTSMYASHQTTRVARSISPPHPPTTTDVQE